MNRRVRRRRFLAAVGATALAGCLGGEATEPAADATRTAGSGVPTADEPLPLPMEPAALSDRAVSGGTSKDGIPAIDDPTFVSAGEAPAGLGPEDPVFGVTLNGTVKAYPQQILAQHEICNDVVGGTPVSVTYCPLTGTAMGFYRGTTTFGVSGRLVNNNLIMYDRATERWWPQVLSTSIPGPWNESTETQSLRQFPVVWTTWKRWRQQHPDTQVLSRNTGFARNYDRDPYGSYAPRKGYYAPEAKPMFPAFSPAAGVGDDVPPKRVVIAARTPDGATAFAKRLLRAEKLVTGALADTPVVAVYDRALDTAWLYLNPEERTFEYADGSVCDADGETHAPDAVPLDRLLAFDAMWFAWGGFYPRTNLYV